MGKLKPIDMRARHAVFARAEDIPTVNFPVCEVMARGCTRKAQDYHHRKRRSQGGEDSTANGLAVCRVCHNYIHENIIRAMNAGWLVKSTADPRLCRVYRRGAWEILT